MFLTITLKFELILLTLKPTYKYISICPIGMEERRKKEAFGLNATCKSIASNTLVLYSIKYEERTKQTGFTLLHYVWKNIVNK